MTPDFFFRNKTNIFPEHPSEGGTMVNTFIFINGDYL